MTGAIHSGVSWRSPLLGAAKSVALAAGTLDYFERGSGPPLVFSHGWLSNANLWRKVVDQLSAHYRCLVLDLPLGSHRTPMPANADLGPIAMASLIADFVVALDLQEATLVGNDSGGAYSQMALACCEAQTGSRVARLVLTSCETPYDEWPPPPFDALPELARDQTEFGQLLEGLRDPAARASPPAYGYLLKHPLDDIVSDSYALAAIGDDRVLRDLCKVVSTASTTPVRLAGERLIERNDLPVLLVWSREDPVFPLEHAIRYSRALGDAHIEILDDAFSFTPEDQPAAVAAAIAEFVPRSVGG